MSPEDIDKLTIAEVRAICERASEALRTLSELGLGAPRATTARASAVGALPAVAPLTVPTAPPTGAAASPFPCTACGRQFGFRGEDVLEATCDACGLPIPAPAGPAASNKGPIQWSPEEQALREMKRLEREGVGP